MVFLPNYLKSEISQPLNNSQSPRPPSTATFGAELAMRLDQPVKNSLYSVLGPDSIKPLTKCVPAKIFHIGTKILEAAQHHKPFHASFKSFKMQSFGKELLL